MLTPLQLVSAKHVAKVLDKCIGLSNFNSRQIGDLLVKEMVSVIFIYYNIGACKHTIIITMELLLVWITIATKQVEFHTYLNQNN